MYTGHCECVPMYTLIYTPPQHTRWDGISIHRLGSMERFLSVWFPVKAKQLILPSTTTIRLTLDTLQYTHRQTERESVWMYVVLVTQSLPGCLATLTLTCICVVLERKRPIIIRVMRLIYSNRRG